MTATRTLLQESRLFDASGRWADDDWFLFEGTRLVAHGSGDAPESADHVRRGLVGLQGVVDGDVEHLDEHGEADPLFDEQPPGASHYDLFGRIRRWVGPSPSFRGDALTQAKRDTAIPGARVLAALAGEDGDITPHVEALMQRNDVVGFLLDAALTADQLDTLIAEIVARTRERSPLLVTPAQDLALRGIATSSPISVMRGWRVSDTQMESARIAMLADMAIRHGVAIHVDRLSTGAGVEALRLARQKGARLTGSVTIAHLYFNDVDLGSDDPAFRLDPPIGTEDDRLALLEGVRDGTIGHIVSGHRTTPDRCRSSVYDEAAPGASLHELLLPALSTLVAHEDFGWNDVARGLLHPDTDTRNVDARDVAWLDPQAAWKVQRQQLRSVNRVTPFHGRLMTGRHLSVYDVFPDCAGG